ncbi:MAG: histidine phosphatase family protein [Nocardioidaceae bacterium]
MSTPGRRLVLWRHGQTSWNAVGRAQGHHDVGLDPTGHAQAAAAAPALAALQPVAVWCSDLSRARQTCDYLERLTGLSAKVDQRLREYDVGARQGMTTAEFAAAFPSAHAAWADGEDMPRVPGAEGAGEVAARIVPVLSEVVGSLAAGETAVAVTHGAALKVALVELLGWPRSQARDLAGVDNCGWVTVTDVAGGSAHRPRLRLAGYNQTAAVRG